MTRQGILTCLLASLLLTASGASATQPAGTSDQASGDSRVAQGEVPANSPVVTLHEAGSEPRRELRYQFPANHDESLVMDMDMSMTMSMGAQQMPQIDMPTMRMLMNIRGTEVTPDGTLRYEFDLADISLVNTEGADPMMLMQLEQEMNQLEGMTGWAQVDSRGFTLDGGVNVPAEADPSVQQLLSNMEQSIHQMSAPLPAEPVGQGARWEVATSMDYAGFAFQQTATYTLTELNDNGGRFEVTVSQAAPRQPMNSPDLPPGAEVMLDLFQSTGSGNVLIDLARLVPTSQMTMNTQMSSTISAGGQTQAMSMEMGMDLTIQPAPAATETPAPTPATPETPPAPTAP